MGCGESDQHAGEDCAYLSREKFLVKLKTNELFCYAVQFHTEECPGFLLQSLILQKAGRLTSIIRGIL